MSIIRWIKNPRSRDGLDTESFLLEIQCLPRLPTNKLQSPPGDMNKNHRKGRAAHLRWETPPIHPGEFVTLRPIPPQAPLSSVRIRVSML